MSNTMVKMLLAAGLCSAAVPALAEIVVIVNPKNPATRMLSDQAAQFFLGKSSLFTPVEFTDSSPLRAEFHSKVLQKDEAQLKAIWSKLVFTGKGVAPREFGTAAEVKKAVAADPRAIGYIDKAALDDSVKAILSVQ